ncbi:MAG: AlpA family phage regulatory protein [Candidatus Competibacteraceae bacterium]|nr:AlpA family phage regulatory protein [Candidatus Competibacteraceae bacterium]
MFNSTTNTSRRRPQPPLGVMLLRQRDICRKTGLSRTKLDSLEMSGRFPRRMRLPGRVVAWRSDEVDRWIEDVSQNRVDLADLRYKRREEREMQHQAAIAAVTAAANVGHD